MAQKEKQGSQKGEETPSTANTGCLEAYFIQPNELLQEVNRLDQSGYFLEDISCVDIQEGFLLVYHFDHYEKPGRIAIRTLISREDPRIDSISGIYPGADWHERESFDFFGVRFDGHPHLIPLLLDPEREEPPPLLKEESDRSSLSDIYPEYASSDEDQPNE